MDIVCTVLADFVLMVFITANIVLKETIRQWSTKGRMTQEEA